MQIDNIKWEWQFVSSDIANWFVSRCVQLWLVVTQTIQRTKDKKTADSVVASKLFSHVLNPEWESNCSQLLLNSIMELFSAAIDSITYTSFPTKTITFKLKKNRFPIIIIQKLLVCRNETKLYSRRHLIAQTNRKLDEKAMRSNYATKKIHIDVLQNFSF